MKSRHIKLKDRLIILKRDNYRCVTCGRHGDSSVGIFLEIDHKQPHSKEGSNELENLQVLCSLCNRGKGNSEEFEIDQYSIILNELNYLNPEISLMLTEKNSVSIVINTEDYSRLLRAGLGEFFDVQLGSNTLSGCGAGRSLGIYTLYDNGGSKTNLFIKSKDSL